MVRLGSLPSRVDLRRSLGSDPMFLQISWRSPAVMEKGKYRLLFYGPDITGVDSMCACVCEFGPASNGNSSRPSVWEGTQVATKLHAAAQAHIVATHRDLSIH